MDIPCQTNVLNNAWMDQVYQHISYRKMKSVSNNYREVHEFEHNIEIHRRHNLIKTQIQERRARYTYTPLTYQISAQSHLYIAEASGVKILVKSLG